MQEFSKLVSQLSDADRLAVAFALANAAAGNDRSSVDFALALTSRLQAPTRN